MRIYKDPIFNFYEYFNENTGSLIRTNIMDDNGVPTDKISRFRSFPELIDVGIMGTCHTNRMWCLKAGIDCYQGNDKHDDMKFEDFKRIVDEAKGKTFQIALGGKGDPNKHKYFRDICEYAYRNQIVPNLTTSGYNISKEEIEIIKKYCGAVAVSLYSNLENGLESNQKNIDVIEELVNENIKTNIHCVVNNDNIEELTFRIKNNMFPKGVNAIIFLLYKPVGFGTIGKCLNKNDTSKLVKFFESIENNAMFKFGFDSCFVPLVKKYMKSIHESSIEVCEAARFSCYISPDMIMYPCSFVQKDEYGIDLKEVSLFDAWTSNNIRKFTSTVPLGCNNCKSHCLGGCQLGYNQSTCCD